MSDSEGKAGKTPMDEYLQNLQSFNDIGQQMGSAAASFYHSVAETGISPDHAAALTQTFVMGFFGMIASGLKKQTESEHSPKDS